MGILINSITDNFILDIVIYLVLFYVIYYMVFTGKNCWNIVIMYIITMEIKFFIERDPMTLTEVIISFFVYLILGLITAKIAYKMFDYYPRSVFIIIGTIVAYLLEILLSGILFLVVSIPIGFIELWIYLIIHSIFN